MRVVFILNSLGAGGTERSTAVLLPALAARGIEPIVVCLRHTSEGDEANVIAQGFAVHFVDETRLVSRVRALRTLLRSLRPDVVHTAIFDADIAGRLAAWRLGVPVVSSLVNTSYDPARLADARVSRRRLAMARVLDAATARWLTTRLHAVSSGVADANAEVMHLDRKRIDVIERGRDLALFGVATPERRRNVRASLGIADTAHVVLSVGRQEFQKGHTVLIEAAPPIAAAVDDTVILIAGREGNATAEIHAALRRWPEADVRLLGHRSDIADLLVAADVFAMPSRYEGTAGAVLEAFAMGVPVVVSDVSGMRGVVTDGENCLLVPVDDVAALASAVIALLSDDERAAQLRDRAASDFAERFTLDRSADRMAAWYRSLGER